MHVFAQIFIFRAGGDAFSQKIEHRVTYFFSDSFVVYFCSYHVLLAEAALSNVVSLMRSLPECGSFERGNKIQSSKLSVATWIFPRNHGEFDRLPCVRTYARIRTATFDIF